MMAESGSATKRHNPVDSIRRKIKTIEMRDQESNQYLHIPKFQSRNFDSPQFSTKKNLEEVLKNRAMKNLVSFSSSPGSGSLSSPAGQHVPGCDSPLSSALYSTCTAAMEQRKKPWASCLSQSCSTPMVGPHGTHKFQSILPAVALEDRIHPFDPNIYCGRMSDQFTQRSPVVKRLSMSESAGLRRRTEQKSEVSLICEEDLLDSIFYACDTEHRGKVAVSKIVDYLRHTTSRGSEDSGLSELCHMLDPERRDISMDLDTYHAIMKEWVDDCRNNGAENAKESALAEESIIKLRESLLAGRRISGSTMNVTCGSLEAFGGDVSRGDLDTSDLITCIADLQYNNQKLQEQQSSLKAVSEAQEECNHRLLEENEELQTQLQSAQQAIAVVRTMKVEMEELKLNMVALEEHKSQLVAHNKQMGKENQSLIHKISSLQEENQRSVLEAEEVRKALSQVTARAADLQLQVTDFESALQKKDADLLVKDLHVEEMKSTLMEYGSVMENLRLEKSKLEQNLQQMEQELLSNGIHSPITYKLSRMMGPSSLHTELEYAQQSLEVSTPDWICSTGRMSSLDITLDREVLLLLQEPVHEQMASEFKTILHGLQKDANTMAEQVLLPLQHLMASDTDVEDRSGKTLMIIEKDVTESKKNWEEKLRQLEKHREALDKEFAKLSGNLRRTKTEQLHLRKELSARAQDLEAARHLQEAAAGREAGILTQLHDSASKQQDLMTQIDDLAISLRAVSSESEELQRELLEARSEQQQLEAAVQAVTSDCRSREQKASEQEETINLLQRQLLDHQTRSLREDDGAQKSSCGRLRTAPGEEAQLGYAPPLEVPARGPQTPNYYLATADRQKPEPGAEDKKRHESEEASVISQRPTLTNAQTDEEILASEMEMLFSKETCRDDAAAAADATSISMISPPSTNNVATEHRPASPVGADLVAILQRSSDVESKDGDEKENAAECSQDSGFTDNEASSVRHKAGDCSTDGGAESSLVRPDSEEKRPPLVEGPGSLRTLQPAEENDRSNNEKEMETEFLRLSLGFKCDIFTLDKRLRLEERSRDLAEENLKKELASCKKLLEALTPLCEEDNQTHDIVKRLEKSLEFLIQHTTRVASRSEMLGAIHQESRVSKAVEVMIQHVENLKRMYATEHAELEELREAMQQSDRSSSPPEREDSLKLASSIASKVSPARRVSMPAYPRGTGSPMDLFGGDKIDGKLQHRRSNSWKLVGSRPNDNRPTLQRFMDTYTRPEASEEAVIKEDESSAALIEEVTEMRVRKPSYIQRGLPPTTTETTYSRVLSCATSLKRSMVNINKPLVVLAVAAVLLVTLFSFLTGLSFHKPVDGAPVGSGASWTSVQQLLWPYLGLRHNAPPPL